MKSRRKTNDAEQRDDELQLRPRLELNPKAAWAAETACMMRHSKRGFGGMQKHGHERETLSRARSVTQLRRDSEVSMIMCCAYYL